MLGISTRAPLPAAIKASHAGVGRQGLLPPEEGEDVGGTPPPNTCNTLSRAKLSAHEVLAVALRPLGAI